MKFYLGKSPLIYVVAQIRFSGVENMSNYVPEIQDQLRKRGFIRFQEGHTANLRFLPTGPEVIQIPKFEFQTRDRQLGIVLSKDAVGLHVSKYSNFSEFANHIGEAVELVHKSVGLHLIDRIGLRYVDLIKPGEGEKLNDYLSPSIVGFPAEVIGGEEIMSSAFHIAARSTLGTLVIRVLRKWGGLALPPDLESSPLDHQLPSVGSNETTCALDFDHFIEMERDPIDFSVGTIIDRLDALHVPMCTAFRATVTPFALDKWS